MKAVYLPFLPKNIERQDGTAGANNAVFGTAVYMAGFADALVRYSTYDTIYISSDNGAPRDKTRLAGAVAAHAGRIVCLAEHELLQIRSTKHLILAAPYQTFSELVRIRKICRRPQTPITGVIHSLNYARQMFAMLDLYMSPLQPFDALICSSTCGHQAVKNFMQCMEERFARAGLGGLRSRVKLPIIPLGIETRDFANTADNEPFRARMAVKNEATVILYFGRLSSGSKADLVPLIIVFSQLAQSYPESILILAGDDSHYGMAEELRAITSALGCADRVRVVPNPTAQDKLQLYHSADIFVSVSDNLQETFGLTIVEAMAAGLPVIASDWNGYKDLVVHGATGYLVGTFLPSYPETFDSVRGNGLMLAEDLLASTTIVDPEALKVFLERLLVNKEHRLTLGEAGQRRAKDLYDWSTIIRQYESLWENLAAEGTSHTSPAAGEQPDLEQWNYKRIFGHYPTSVIGGEFRIRITRWGRNWRSQSTLLMKVATPESWFSISRIRQILELIEARGEISIRELRLAEANRTGQCKDSALFLSYVYRLLKYGFLEMCSAPRQKIKAEVNPF